MEDTSQDTVVSAAKLNTPFYYDKQITNRLTSVYLHANRILDGDKWKEPDEPVDDDGYMIRPLCRAILDEDYQVAVSNSWSQFGEDEIGSLFNSLKPYAPYAAHLANAASSMLGTMENMEISKDPNVNSSFSTVMKKLVTGVKDVSEKGAKILNKSLVAQGARFSYYSGTGVGFGNLTMKFTVFAGYLQNYKTGKFEWKTTEEQLSELYPYIMGKYTNGILDSKTGEIQGTGINSGVKGETAELINEFFSWQLPPGGYEPDIINIDKVQVGTLKLRFGVFYSLPSLVCTNAQFQSSKQMVKHWNGTLNKLSPLFCDVVLTFQPATKYSDDALKRFISGENEKDAVTSTKTGLNNKLIEEKNKLKTLLGG